MHQIGELRIAWLERQLDQFDQAEIAAVGGRVRASICDECAADPYEVALGVTLNVLKLRAAMRSKPASASAERIDGLLLEPMAA